MVTDGAFSCSKSAVNFRQGAQARLGYLCQRSYSKMREGWSDQPPVPENAAYPKHPQMCCFYHGPNRETKPAQLLQSIFVLSGPVCLPSHQYVPSQVVCVCVVFVVLCVLCCVCIVYCVLYMLCVRCACCMCYFCVCGFVCVCCISVCCVCVRCIYCENSVGV